MPHQKPQPVLSQLPIPQTLKNHFLSFTFSFINNFSCFILYVNSIKWYVSFYIVSFFKISFNSPLFKFYLFFILAALGLRYGTWASLVVALGLSCPSACGILVPQPGIEPASPALEGGFLTTGPPGKSVSSVFYSKMFCCPQLGNLCTFINLFLCL